MYLCHTRHSDNNLSSFDQQTWIVYIHNLAEKSINQIHILVTFDILKYKYIARPNRKSIDNVIQSYANITFSKFLVHSNN